MKYPLIALVIAFSLSACEDVNLFVMTDAATDAVTAVTLSDEEVRQLAERAVSELDEKNRVAPAGTPQAARLQRLTAPYRSRDGRTFNYRVYLTDDINAFAMADGSIRVFSGLMEMLDDGELLFIIGHEMGHVVEEHSRKKVVMAYATSAVRKGLASYDSEIGQLAGSLVGALAEQLANAQFSQHEERQADSYGLGFINELGYDKAPAVSALHKLGELARNHTLLSSHPDPESRARRLQEGDGETGEGGDSLAATVIDYGLGLLVWLLGLVRAVLHWLLSLL